MIVEYIEEALRRAHYDKIDDKEPFYGEVEALKGVWATGRTLEECRERLKNVIEGWLIISLREGLKIPRLGKYAIQEERQTAA